jgi:hypothetical protein
MTVTAATMVVRLVARISSVIVCLSLGFNPQALAKGPEPIVIAVLDTGEHSPHQAKVVAALKALLVDCRICEIKTFPIYDSQGSLSEKTFLPALKRAAAESKIIHLSWNTLSTPQMKEIEVELNRVSKVRVVIAAAGVPETEIAAPLSKTVMGKIPQVLIVGEAGPKGHLVANSYFGPEMLTALSVPEGAPRGSSFSSLKLTAAIAKLMAKNPQKSSSQIFEELQKAKKKSFSNQPTLSELGLN